MENGQKSQHHDPVNHPAHYNQYTGFEVIDVCEQLRAPDGTGNYNRGSVFKYLSRAGWKDPKKHVEDLEKAEFYLKREIARVKLDILSNSQPKAEFYPPLCACGFIMHDAANEPGLFFCDNVKGHPNKKTVEFRRP